MSSYRQGDGQGDRWMQRLSYEWRINVHSFIGISIAITVIIIIIIIIIIVVCTLSASERVEFVRPV